MAKFLRVVFALSFLCCLSQAAFAVTYTVTKIADTNDGMCDGDCSLREAIAAANATVDNDDIAFSALFSAAQTITLSGTDLIITNNGTLTINGPGANLLTVSGNGASRVFTNNVSAVTNINNLRVTGGNAVSGVQTGRGGGVYNHGGTLTLMNVIITGNTGANGGGTNNAAATGGFNGNLTVINCEISNNTSSSSGGGMQNFSTSTLTLVNSLVSGNTSNSAGIGGAFQANGTVVISNSTFSGNSTPAGTGGAMYYNGTSLTMNNVTITDNSSLNGGGGLHKATATLNANVRNTIIAGNRGAAATPDVAGAISSQGNNLIGSVGSSTGWVVADLLNRAAFLAPLANNGGPTRTHALLPTSPAINAGNNCVQTASCGAGNPPAALTTDQRGTGFPRLVATNVDIGAYESPFLAPTALFDFDGDGKTDYAVFRSSIGSWFIERSTAGFTSVNFGISTDRLTPADFDGDGKTDIAVWRENAGDPERAYFYILQSATNTLRADQFGRTGDSPRVVGDWDGDGRDDVAVYRNGTGGGQSFFFYRPSSQPAVDFVPILWGIGGDEAVRGDFDGDGKLDAAVFRPSDLIWYICQSSNNQPRYENWGVASDKRIPGDYDGDGKTDFAVFRNGLWAILQSSNNLQTFRQYGVAGDTPLLGDYDGDGKTDLAVWRNGTFFSLRSSNNISVGFQFGLGIDTPVASAYIP
jgi:CSLREA domain-containing protein